VAENQLNFSTASPAVRSGIRPAENTKLNVVEDTELVVKRKDCSADAVHGHVPSGCGRSNNARAGEKYLDRGFREWREETKRY
jgi:hypothetical protein